MWEALGNILTSSNVIPIGVFIIAIIVTLSILAKLGIVSFNGKGVSVGNGDKERTIIRHQIDYVESTCADFYTRVEKKSSFEEWRARFILERVYDVLVRIISYNHIQVEDTYIELRQTEIWKTLLDYIKPGDDPYYTSREFKDIVYGEVRNIITKLVHIREFYSK